MVRVRIIKDGEFRQNQVVEVSRNTAHRLIERGEGELIPAGDGTYQNRMLVTPPLVVVQESPAPPSEPSKIPNPEEDHGTGTGE
jgi:hypothetical protein